MDDASRQALEAILFVVDEPVDVSTLSQVLEIGRTEVESELRRLADQLEQERRGFVLREVAGGWRFYTAADAAPYVERWVLAGRSGRLTQAALETLAVIAYKQPISRQSVSEVRGVNADGAVRTLVARGLVQEVGRDSGPGQAILYGTTSTFLEHIGLNELGELPPLTEFLREGSAPDEPTPDHLRAARAFLQAGRDLPSTGRSSWDPDGPDDAEQPDASPVLAAVDPASSRRRREEEMDGLTDALEQVARRAVAALDEVVAAITEDADDPTDVDRQVDADEDGGRAYPEEA